MKINTETHITNSEDETRALGRKFAETLRGGTVILLEGDLGTGKTVFVRGVGEALGVTGVRSPSFTLINEYESTSGFFVVHADLYRLDQEGVNATGLDEYAGSDEAVVFVEWPERWTNPPSDSVRIYFRALSENEREIKIERSFSS